MLEPVCTNTVLSWPRAAAAKRNASAANDFRQSSDFERTRLSLGVPSFVQIS